MITQEQYDQLNDGDTITACYSSPTGVEFEVTGKIYVWGRLKHLAGWALTPDFGAGRYWTIIEHIPAIPDWHSAQAISAEVEDAEGRVLLVRPIQNRLWFSPALRRTFESSDLSNVRILVDKDVEL
jgi:hypothetical protein